MQGNSLDDQTKAINAHAKARGLTVAKIYAEAESGGGHRGEKREEQHKLLSQIQAGDVVLVDKLDRWSRDPEFSHRTVREILDAGASIYFVGEAIDPNTPDGDTRFNFAVAVAREEHKRIRERMVGTRDRLRDAGFYAQGNEPLGYRRSAPKGVRDPEKNVLVIEKDEAAIVRGIFSMCIAGKSMGKIAKHYGLKLDRVKDALDRRLYTGEMQNTKGEWIQGRHQAIVSVDTFMRARAALDARRLGGPRPRDAAARTDDWILRDVATCARCGARMSAAYAGRNDDGSYNRLYYKCSHKCTTRDRKGARRANSRAHVAVRDVEAKAVPMVLARLVDLREHLSKVPTSKTSEPSALDVAAKRKKLDAKRARYLEMYADGMMEKPAMLVAVAKVDAELLALKKPVARAPLAKPEVRRDLLQNVQAIEKAWANSGPERRREIVGAIAKAFKLAAGAAPVPVWYSLEDLAAPFVAAAKYGS